MSNIIDSEEKQFEDAVLDVARQRWPSAEDGGSEIINQRERDGVFIGEEMINLVECTTSRTKAKAEKDIEKLVELVDKFSKEFPDKGVKGWFITREEPTADQRAVAQKTNRKVVAQSFHQFQSKLIDARGYIQLRENYAFGSVRDPDTEGLHEPIEYIALDIIERRSRQAFSVSEISSSLGAGKRFVLLGDYGAGKSMTLREIFRRLSQDVKATRDFRFPVLLNLRDHRGQTEPSEALERHARRIGFGNPFHLVRAWRAGYVTLMLDGFDEITASGWPGKAKKLRDIRRQSVTLIRDLIVQTPKSAGIVVAGREHFFDSAKELEDSLGTQNFAVLALNDFNNKQIERYLKSKGYTGEIPAWLPARPLLLGYLAAKNLLIETLTLDAGSGAAMGWHALLDRISKRESQIRPDIMAEDSVRRIIEWLSTAARRHPDGLGPLGMDEIFRAFELVCGFAPDEEAKLLLQRLPGLGVYAEQEGTRIFIDTDFAGAARSGDLFRYIVDPFNTDQLNEPNTWQCPLTQIGVELTALRINKDGIPSAKLDVAAHKATEQPGWDMVTFDVLQVAFEMGLDEPKINTYIAGQWLPELSLNNLPVAASSLEFQDCVIGRLSLQGELAESELPRFVRCHIGVLEGRRDKKSLPATTFVDCEIDTFDEVFQPSSGLMNLDLPLGSKVLLTILRKLYIQKGSGRKESALYRGMDPRAAELVDDVLSLLMREGLVIRSKVREQTVWLPVRSQMARVKAILAAPDTSTDSLLKSSEDFG